MRNIKKKSKKAVILSGLIALLMASIAGYTIALLLDMTEDVNNAFKPTEVTCAVTEDFNKSVKSNVAVTNTGDDNAFIRATFVINWVDSDGNIAPISAEPSDYEILLGTGWIAGADGFYYYPSVIAPGVSTAKADGTGYLINSIKPKVSKDGYVLSVEIVADAIQADGKTSEGQPAEIAWTNDKVEIIVDDAATTLTVRNK